MSLPIFRRLNEHSQPLVYLYPKTGSIQSASQGSGKSITLSVSGKRSLIGHEPETCFVFEADMKPSCNSDPINISLHLYSLVSNTSRDEYYKDLNSYQLKNRHDNYWEFWDK